MLISRVSYLLCILSVMGLFVQSIQAETALRAYGPFNVTFYNNGDSDDGGVTVGTQDWTSDQMDAIAACIDVWDSKITNTPGRQMELHMFWSSLGGALGSASTPNLSIGGNTYSFVEYAWRQGNTYDSPSYSYDSRIKYDPSFSWNFGADAPDNTEFDFRSVITHELGHSVGFGNRTYNSSTDLFGANGISAWESFLRDDAGNMPYKGTTGSPEDFNQFDNPVWFVGSAAMAANGGNQVPVYAPTTWASGSSLAHLDDSQFQDALMSYSIGKGQMAREPGSVEWGVMTDMGWSVVPEPATSVLLIILCGCLLSTTVVRKARCRSRSE
jgi:hypothetical protein